MIVREREQPSRRRGRELGAESRQRLLGPRLVLLFLVGCLVFGYPILGLFSRPLRVVGVPLLYVYIFVAWGAFIAVLAWLIDPGARRRW